MQGIYDELREVGIKCIGLEHNEEKNNNFNYYGDIVADPSIKAVVS